jgi:hypothetical protein
MKTILIFLLLSVSSCSLKPKIVYIHPEPFSFQKTEPLAFRVIRVHKQDRALYDAYIKALRAQPEFHNQQIDDYFSFFKQNEEKQSFLFGKNIRK